MFILIFLGLFVLEGILVKKKKHQDSACLLLKKKLTKLTKQKKLDVAVSII